MKKIVISLLMVVLAFSLAACSSGAKDDSSKKEDTKTSTSSSKEKVLNYYMDVVSQISDKNADFSAFQQAQSADPKPTDAELSELAKKGTVSAQAVSDMLKDEKVPDLGKSTDKFKTAISDLSAAYGQEAEALKAAKPDTAAADEALQKAADEIAKILKDNGLAGSDILTDTM